MKNRLLGLLAPCAAIFGVSAYAAENVVVESNAARYTTGTVLDASARIELERGEFLLIATEDARFVRVEGPHSGPAAGPAPDENALRRALARLFGVERSGVDGVGAVRAAIETSAVAEDTRPDPWLVHSERGGDQCVVRGRDVELWREHPSDDAPWELTTRGRERSATIAWPAGEQRTAWPAALPVRDGGIFLVRRPAALRFVTITIHQLEPDIASNPLAAVAWLEAKGCLAQARAVVR